MNILILNHYAGSPELGMEFRPYYLAREWIKLGHKVFIVAADFSHLRLKQPSVVYNLQYEKVDEINYFWLKTLKYTSANYKRLLNMLAFILKSVIYFKKISKIVNPQVVIASSTYTFDIYPAYFIARKSDAKLVIELRDLWPLSPMILGNYSKMNPFIWTMQRAANFSYRRCDCCISVLANAKDYLVQHGLKEEKFFYIPNGFSEDELRSTRKQIPGEYAELLSRIKVKSKTIIGYTGGHAPSNALKSLMEASKYFANNDDITFVLIGDGSQKHELMESVRLNDQKNVYFLPTISKSLMPKLLMQFDILYAGGIKSILHSYGTSFNKITDYMLAKKPIIFAVDEPDSLIKKTGCGIQIPAENISELIKVIKFLSELPTVERNNMGEKGRKYALKELKYRSLAKKFIKAVESC